MHGFRAEAELLGGLESPYVAGFYEYVEAPEGAAIVMELVDGVSLRTLLTRQSPLSPESALVVLKGSLLGLADAHRAGVVHRDYKPENVLVAVDGSSKLVDFGIAAGRGTTPGVAGTPAYMAPEQWQGRPASPAADVYAARATPSSSVTKASAFSGRCSGCLARPRRISGRTGSGASVSGTGASMCWTASSAKFSPSYGLRPVRHSKKVAVAAYTSAAGEAGRPCHCSGAM